MAQKYLEKSVCGLLRGTSQQSEL